MFNICIIGAGQLGSRHLQALKSVDVPLNIRVYDNDALALNIAKMRYESVLSEKGERHNIKYGKLEENEVEKYDIAIIATSSGSRKKVIEQLLSLAKVEYFILEKVLFQYVDDYSAIQQVFVEHSVKNAWINCGRREWGIYKEIKKEICSPVYMKVSGVNWGLMCNSIHFIDLTAFFTECLDFEVKMDELDPVLHDSKRQGYKESTGTLKIKFKDGSRLELNSRNTSERIPMMLKIETNSFRAIIFESQGMMFYQKEGQDFRLESKTFNVPLQSESTAALVEEILENGVCGLSDYTESRRLHIQFMEPVITFLNEKNMCRERFFPFT